MTKLIQPLNITVPIVDGNGRPTAQFARILQGISLGTGILKSTGGSISLDYSTVVRKAGDTMTGPLIITGVTNPLTLTNLGNCEATITSQGRSRFIIARYSNDAFSNSNLVQKARGTIAAPLAVLTNDAVGLCEAQAYGGSSFLPVAKIQSLVVTAAPSSTDMESQLSLEVVPAGSITSTQIALFRYATGLTMYGTHVVIDQNSLINLRNYSSGTLPSPGTAGRLAYDAAAGAPVYDNGAAWTSFGGGGGSYVLLEQHIAAGSATLDFTTGITATYDDYEFEFIQLVPATSGANPWMRFSTNGGTSYDASAIYDFSNNFWGSGNFNANNGAENQAQAVLHNPGIGNTTGLSASGNLKLFNPASASLYKQFNFQFAGSASDGHFYNTLGAGRYKSATAVNAVRFMMASGNITSGIIRLYGRAKV